MNGFRTLNANDKKSVSKIRAYFGTVLPGLVKRDSFAVVRNGDCF